MNPPCGRMALWRLAVRRIAANQVDQLALDVVMCGAVWSPGGFATPNVSVVELRESIQADLAVRRAVRDLEYYLASGEHGHSSPTDRESRS